MMVIAPGGQIPNVTFKRPGPAPCRPWPDSRLLWGRATGRGQLASEIHSDSGLPVPARGLRSRGMPSGVPAVELAYTL